ncbi:MAG: ATP-dependent DNA helicase RecG [Clostridiales bacterium]|nr:ATP-dependent DNA helicase RecG [Clostridiales bacterium]
MELTDLKGIGEKTAKILTDAGMARPEDLLSCLPLSYIDTRHPKPLRDVDEGEFACVAALVERAPTVYYFKGSARVTVACVSGADRLSLCFMNQSYRAGQFTIGQKLLVYGCFGGHPKRSVWNPVLCKPEDGILPRYKPLKGVAQTTLRRAIAQALELCPVAELPDESLFADLGLMRRGEAYRVAHFPTDTGELARAQTRLAFDKAFAYLLSVARRRAERRAQGGRAFAMEDLPENFIATLPFSPTRAQERVLLEISADMSLSAPMNRLVQGDVGCGKTLLAEYALFAAAENGRQGALLAPTEILARQHYAHLQQRFGEHCVLLLGGQTAATTRAAKAALQSGTAQIVVGTHALLTENVAFTNLALLVVDEQHRFGVAQRAGLAAKGSAPDMLVMSATPIPRTLAMTLFGDLDISAVDELPAGRLPVKTRYIAPAKRAEMYRYIAEQAANGVQSYVVCPCIEAAEGLEGLSAKEIYKELQSLCAGARIALLHGKLSSKEKTRVMQAFADGAADILVTTTVIEVGVHMPNANCMVIEGAERFGLSTLHQLRGRIGRGTVEAHCFLLSRSRSLSTRERLEVLLSGADGFAVAEEDLRLRGAGDYFGQRQSGEDATARSLYNINAAVIAMAQDAVFRVERLAAGEREKWFDTLCGDARADAIVMN